MELQEFKDKLNLRYTFGERRKNGASRRYHDRDFNIGSELHTPYNEETMEWGKGDITYYFEDSKKEHKSIESLYEEFLERSAR